MTFFVEPEEETSTTCRHHQNGSFCHQHFTNGIDLFSRDATISTGVDLIWRHVIIFQGPSTRRLKKNNHKATFWVFKNLLFQKITADFHRTSSGKNTIEIDIKGKEELCIPQHKIMKKRFSIKGTAVYIYWLEAKVLNDYLFTIYIPQ